MLRHNLRSHNLQARALANEAEVLAVGEHPVDRVLALTNEMGHRLNKQGQGNIEEVNVGLCRDFNAHGLQELRDDKHHPHLLHDQQPLATPPVMQPQQLFEGQKGQFNIPSSGVERCDIDQRELCRVQDVGQVEPKLLAIAKAHQADCMTGMGSFAGSEPTTASKIS